MEIENTWFISDLHLNHDWVNKTGERRGVCLFERTQFNSIQEHDEFVHDSLIDWGHRHEESTLFILGDFGDINKLRPIVQELQYSCGIEIIGVKGNHDTNDNTLPLAMLFDDYYTRPQYIHPRIIVSHEPQFPAPAGAVNIHGHLHASKLDSPQHLNASIHVINYVPIGWKTIQKAFQKIEKPCYKFLQEPYRDKYMFTQPKADAVYDKSGRIKLKESLALYNKKYDKNIK